LNVSGGSVDVSVALAPGGGAGESEDPTAPTTTVVTAPSNTRRRSNCRTRSVDAFERRRQRVPRLLSRRDPVNHESRIFAKPSGKELNR
jgi:hypothetical protein